MTEPKNQEHRTRRTGPEDYVEVRRTGRRESSQVRGWMTAELSMEAVTKKIKMGQRQIRDGGPSDCIGDAARQSSKKMKKTQLNTENGVARVGGNKARQHAGDGSSTSSLPKADRDQIWQPLS
ncbi:hypothetical protein PIB30_065566 [Stylosanthes scabra]|uniref:Uncharacterized protein n=1 Tax=Stylosanthes scabra TaxID=79078 RepID=A0ABU6RLY2_9FABA|nr:hypothetical protein [Stylosanthes scabra]